MTISKSKFKEGIELLESTVTDVELFLIKMILSQENNKEKRLFFCRPQQIQQKNIIHLPHNVLIRIHIRVLIIVPYIQKQFEYGDIQFSSVHQQANINITI